MPTAGDQFIRSQRVPILHFGSWRYLKVQYRQRFPAAYGCVSDLSDHRRQRPAILDALRQGNAKRRRNWISLHIDWPSTET
jgi:hypothetical protein